MISQPPGYCLMVGGALAWPSGRKAGMRLGATARQGLRPETSYGWLHLSHHGSHQIMDLRVIGAECQLHHQCHQCLRGWEGQGVHGMANDPTGNQEAI